MPRRWSGIDLSPTAAFWLTVVLLFSASAYFTVSVELKRSSWRARKTTATLSHEEKVEVVTIVDGDEISIKRGEDIFVIRLLGIKSFDSKVSEPGVSEFGAAAQNTLRTLFEGSAEATVEFPAGVFKRDRHNRVLAYLRKDGLDVGALLVARGQSLVLTAYPFDREAAYIGAQQVARQRGDGLWTSKKASARADGLEREWRVKRSQN